MKYGNMNIKLSNALCWNSFRNFSHYYDNRPSSVWF